MKKEEQLFKKSIEQIKIPHQKLDEIIEKTIQSSESPKNKSIKRRAGLGVAAAIIGLGVVIGSANVSPSFASTLSQIPIIGTFVTVGDDGLKSVSEQGLTDLVEQSITKGDETVTIDEAYFDGTRLTVGYTIQTKKPLAEDEMPTIGLADISIDGVKQDGFTLNGTGQLVNETTFTGYYNLDNLSKELPEDFNLELHFVGDKNKKWDFQFPIKKNHLVKNQAIHVTQQVDGIEINLLHLQTGPAGTELEYEVISDKNISDITPFFNLNAKDDLNKDLSEYAGGGTIEHLERGEKHVLKGKILLNPISEHASQIIVTPEFVSGESEFVESGNESEKTIVKKFDASEMDTKFKEMIIDLQ